jgi:hypothetical protein
LSIPSTANFDTFIKVIKKGMSIGKLKIAIIPKLPFVFAAIADIIVRITENPILPIVRHSMNINRF